MVKLRFLFFPCFVLATAVPGAETTPVPASTDPVLERFEPLEAFRGAPIKIAGQNLKDKTVKVTLRRSDETTVPPFCQQELEPKPVTVDNTSATFVIDPDACLGSYTVTA